MDDAGNVETYYDERVAGKLRDFTRPNPRIEAAIVLIAEWAPASPKRVLEIGCGVGATCWRMARAWPDAEVVGSDISPQSIAVAKACFRRPNLSYVNGPLAESVPAGAYDLVVMTDVYEHIHPDDRPALHAAIRGFLAPDSRFILTVPTPAIQQWCREHEPQALQPVDEDIGAAEIVALAAGTATRQLFYREVGIWQYGDYFHLVLGRLDTLSAVAARQAAPAGRAATLKAKAKSILGRTALEVGRRDYLGDDVLRSARSGRAKRFEVSLAERRGLAAAWLARRNAGSEDAG
jgi:2-polyprenyl-3-methyl-5-hydroxy-6-metoxy-1,4-benzoquinol methylase